MFIGVSMQLRVVFKYVFLVLIPYCWSVALEKKKKKKNVRMPACALGAERAAACLFCCLAVQLASWLLAGGL